MDDKKAQNEGLAKIKEIFEEGTAEIHEHKYTFLKVNHKKRLRVFGFLSSIQHELAVGNMGFLGRDDWELIEQTIMSVVSYDNEVLKQRHNHWDDFAEDYIIFITTALQVISYPFLAGSVTG